MRYKYIYDPIALTEYKDAVLWYNTQSKIAALKFRNEIKERIARICKYPFRYRNTYKHFRESGLKRFPYFIVYIIGGK